MASEQVRYDLYSLLFLHFTTFFRYFLLSEWLVIHFEL